MKVVTRDENGTYYIHATFANTIVGGLLMFAISTAGYMALWNRDDAAWKAAAAERYNSTISSLNRLDTRMTAMELRADQITTNTQHLREIDNRLSAIESKRSVTIGQFNERDQR